MLFFGLFQRLLIYVILHPEADTFGIEAQESISHPDVLLVFIFYAYFIRILITT
jgi:hypothetical protein